MRQIKRAGISVLWIERDEDPLVALTFRVGRIDEPFVVGGITHLVEHLALSELGESSHTINGAVAIDQTVFSSHGTVEEVTAFLAHTIGALRALPFHRLAIERGVLDAEAGDRLGLDTLSFLSHTRWGFQSLDRRGSEELALRTADPEVLTAWSRDHFTAAGAVLCWVGPEPPEFSWHLLEGPVSALPAVPAALVPLPYAMEGSDGVVAVSMTLPSDMSARVFIELLRRRLSAVLRHERGLVYLVESLFEHFTPGLAHAAILINVREPHAQAVSDACITELQRLAAGTVSEEELVASRRSVIEYANDSEWLMGHLREMASAIASGQGARDVATEVARVADTGASTIVSLARESLATAIHLAPSYVDAPQGWSTSADLMTMAPVSGSRFRTKKLCGSCRDTLTLGDAGFTLQVGKSEPDTLLWRDVIAAIRSETGEYNLTSVTGEVWTLEPSWFEIAPEVLAALIGQHLNPAVMVPSAAS